MIKYENQCVGCATESYPCLGDSCPNISVPCLYCDECEEEFDQLRDYDGEQLCDNCLLNKFDYVRE